MYLRLKSLYHHGMLIQKIVQLPELSRSANHIGGVMVSVLALSEVDGGFKRHLGQTKHFKIGICYLSAVWEAFRSKSKDGLAWNQDNVLRVECHIYQMTVVSREDNIILSKDNLFSKIFHDKAEKLHS